MLHTIFNHAIEILLLITAIGGLGMASDTTTSDDDWYAHPMNKDGMNYKD